MRYVLFGILCATALQCRDIQPFPVPSHVVGYQINGTVLIANGSPLEGVDVILDFFVGSEATPVDTQAVLLTDSTLFVDISVYNSLNVYVRRLFAGFRPPGVVPRARWDGLDNGGKAVPSGKYLIRYTIGSAVAKQIPTIVFAHSTASTDVNGHFTITNDHLPIGERFDIYDDNGVYVQTVKTLPEVLLEFKKLSLDQAFQIQLTKNQIMTGVFTLQ